MKKPIIFLLGLMLLSTSTSIYSQNNDDTAERVAKDFTMTAKKATPAVVYIKTESRGGIQSDDPRRDLHEFFQDDFFGRFFGGPRNGNGFGPPQPRMAQGSGFLISNDGYILTNNHVVNGADKITVQLNDGREFNAEVVGKDPHSDLAAIKIDGKNLPFLTLGDSSKLEPGQWVIAIGNPLGLQASLTVGVVSATGRANLDLANFEDFIQTDAAINEGNSGGPLLNLDGEVIGINTAIATRSGGYMGIGFAIPSNMVKMIKKQLIEKGSVTRGFLGVKLQPIDFDLAQAFGLETVQGALVVEVVPDSPADKAGLKQGDVIIEHDNQKVDKPSTFRNSVALIPPGSNVKLTIKRGDEILNYTVNIGEHPDNLAAEEEGKAEPTKLGFTVEALTPEIAAQLGYNGEKGVIVTSVDPHSAAGFAGIKKGTLILSVNQKKVTTPDEFYKATKELEGQSGVLLLLKQGGVVRYLFLKNQ